MRFCSFICTPRRRVPRSEVLSAASREVYCLLTLIDGSRDRRFVEKKEESPGFGHSAFNIYPASVPIGEPIPVGVRVFGACFGTTTTLMSCSADSSEGSFSSPGVLRGR